MLLRLALACLTALAATGSALAECTDDWVQPTAQTMDVSDGTRFRLTRFANMETQLSVVTREQAFEVVFIQGGYLVKGVPAAELQRFAQDAHWWTLFSSPASTAVWMAVRVPPCKAKGSYAIAQDVNPRGANRMGDLKLLRATGEAVADGNGLIRYTLRFDTEPALPPERALTATGTLSFVKQGDALPGDTNVGGFSQVGSGAVAPAGTTLSQLRAQRAGAAR